MLRQHKRRIVDRIEKTMPEEALDMGTTVMVMQVSCKDPGCVPLETAIIIVFPKCGDQELVPGLPESVGGSYKTKILKPMANVTDEDILDNLPPAFEGGRRTMAKVCLYARDVMFAQITQLFGDGSPGNNDGSVEDRTAMATYLKMCLDDYMANGCKPPEFGKPFEGIATLAEIPKEILKGDDDDGDMDMEIEDNSNSMQAMPQASSIPATGNVVIRRKPQETSLAATTTTSIRY